MNDKAICDLIAEGAKPPTFRGLTPEKLPSLPNLAKIVLDSTQTQAGRTNVVTQFLISILQLAQKSMSHHLPSAITITPDNSLQDSGDLFATMVFATKGGKKPEKEYHGGFKIDSAEKAEKYMEMAFRFHYEHSIAPGHEGPHHKQLFFAAQRVRFGWGATQRYASAWSEKFGLISDPEGDPILRIENKKDSNALRNDVLKKAKRLRAPVGLDANLKWGPKRVILSGYLPVSEWDSEFAKGLVNLGLPLLSFPGSPPEALLNVDKYALFAMIFNIVDLNTRLLEEPSNLVPDNWSNLYSKELRLRLRHLPDTFDYAIQKLARQIYPLSTKIVSTCDTGPNPNSNETLALIHDLYENGIRGLTLSIANLAWHGLGLDLSLPTKAIGRIEVDPGIRARS